MSKYEMALLSTGLWGYHWIPKVYYKDFAVSIRGTVFLLFAITFPTGGTKTRGLLILLEVKSPTLLKLIILDKDFYRLMVRPVLAVFCASYFWLDL
jgi:hypothetical protein